MTIMFIILALIASIFVYALHHRNDGSIEALIINLILIAFVGACSVSPKGVPGFNEMREEIKLCKKINNTECSIEWQATPVLQSLKLHKEDIE